MVDIPGGGSTAYPWRANAPSFCSYCGRPGQRLRCKCKRATYCGDECQHKHWAIHRLNPCAQAPQDAPGRARTRSNTVWSRSPAGRAAASPGGSTTETTDRRTSAENALSPVRSRSRAGSALRSSDRCPAPEEGGARTETPGLTADPGGGRTDQNIVRLATAYIAKHTRERPTGEEGRALLVKWEATRSEESASALARWISHLGIHILGNLEPAVAASVETTPKEFGLMGLIVHFTSQYGRLKPTRPARRPRRVSDRRPRGVCRSVSDLVVQHTGAFPRFLEDTVSTIEELQRA